MKKSKRSVPFLLPAFAGLLLFPVLFCTGCSSYRVTVIDPDGQAVSHALLVVREVSMFLPKSLQSASFYRTDDKGCSTIKESPNFDLCCGKIGYWTTCDFEETEKKHITIVLRPATPENAKPGTMFTLYVDDMSEQELYPEWIACLDWQRIRLKELENPLDEEMSSFLKLYCGASCRNLGLLLELLPELAEKMGHLPILFYW